MDLRKGILTVACLVLVVIIFARLTTPTIELDITPTETPTEIPTETPTETASLIIDSPAPEPVEVIEIVTYYDCPLSHDLQDYIRTLCEEKDVPMLAIIALIAQESTFNAAAVSGTHDYGLMQINQCNHDWLSATYGITDFLDPYQNVFCGISILGDHMACYGDLTKALMAYNMGATGAKNAWDSGITHTTYTDIIFEKMAEYEQLTIDVDVITKGG